VKWFWNKCRRYEVKLSLLAADALAAEERGGVRAHLDECHTCQVRLAELKALANRCEQLGGALPQVEPSVALRRRWMTAVRGSVRSPSAATR
jgi:anti-sigma factor RsiW